MPRKKRLFLLLAAIAVVVPALLLLLQTPLIKNRIARYIESRLDQEYAIHSSIGSLDYKLLPLRLFVRDLRIKNDRKEREAFLIVSFLRIDIPYSTFWRRDRVNRLQANIEKVDAERLPKAALRKLKSVRISIDQFLLQIKVIRYSRLEFTNASLTAQGDGAHWQIQRGYAESDNSRLLIHGTIRTDGRDSDFDYQIHSDLTDVRKFASGIPPITGKLSTSGKFKGTRSSFLISGKANVNSFEVFPDQNLHMIGEYEMKAGDRIPLSGAYKISVASSTRNITGKLNGFFDASEIKVTHGSVDWQNDTKRHFEIREAVYSLQTSSGHVLAETELGTVNLRFTNRATTFLFDASVAELAMRIHGNFEWNRRTYVSFIELKASPLSRLGQLLNAQTRGLSGKITADIHAEGSAKHWIPKKAEGKILFAVLERNDIRATIEQSRFSFANERFSLNFHGRMPDGHYNLSGVVPLRPDASLNLQLRANADLAILRLVSPQWIVPQGEFHANLEIAGSRQRPLFSGAVESNKFFFMVGGRHRVDGTNLVALFKQNEIRAAGTVEWNDGLLNVEIDARGKGLNVKDWNGSGTVRATDLRWHNMPLILSNEIRFNLSDGAFSIPSTKIEVKDLASLEVAGQVQLEQGALDLRAKMFSDLSLMKFARPGIHASGKIFGDIRLLGAIKNPQMSGSMKLQNAFLRSSTFPYALENTQAYASLNNDSIRLEKLNGTLAGGSIQATGILHLAGWFPVDSNISLQLKNAGFNYPEDVKTQLSADLQLKGVQNPSLTGKIELSHAVITRNVEDRIRSNVGVLLQRLLLSQQPAAIPLAIDLRINNRDPLLISNNLGRIEANMNLRLQGRLDSPRLGGVVGVRKGSKLFLQTREFSIERGLIRFDPAKQAVPQLDILLASQIADDETKQIYNIELPIYGPLNDLADLNPKSSPDLLPEQAYFLLLTGRAEGQLTPAESHFVRQQLLDYYSVKPVLPVPEMVPAEASLSSVDIHPELISSERDPGSRLLKGKDLLSGISFIYSLPLASSQEQTWILNYRFRKNISFRFIEQDDGTYSSGLHHSVRFGQRLPHHSPPPQRHSVETIGEVRFENRSPIPENELKQMLNLGSGDSYDYWDLQQRLFVLKEELQKSGYLFPSTIAHAQRKGDRIDLSISVDSREPREMIFHGFEPQQEQQERYRRWWREGFDESAVLSMVKQDVLQELWSAGFHEAFVRISQQKSNEKIQFHIEAQPGRKFPPVRIKFSGITKEESDQLWKDLQQETGGDPSILSLHDFHTLQMNIQLINASNGYLNSTVIEGPIRFHESSVEKEIRIQKGKITRIAAVMIDSRPIPEELLRQLKLPPQEIYDASLVVEDELIIARHFEERGYLGVRVKGEVRIQGSNLLIAYRLTKSGPAKVRNIIIQGNTHTSKGAILDRLPFESGDMLTPALLGQAQKTLYETKLFQEVKVEAAQVEHSNVYDVAIELVEIGKYELSYGVGYNSEKRFEASFQASNWNFLGRGHPISFLAKWNAEDRIERLVYHVPDSTGLNWNTLVAASYEELEQPLLFTVTKGIQMQKQFRFVGPSVLVSDYRFDRVQVTEKDPTEIYYVGEAPANVSRFGITLLADTRNDPLIPKKGTLLSVQTSFASSGLGSDVSFLKNYTQFYYYRSFGDIVLASALRFGAARTPGEDLIATERFFAGGSFSVRGFEKSRLGPTDPVWGRPMGGEALLVVNQEVRFPLPIHEWLGAVVFYDAGNVYRKWKDFDPFELRHSAGAGLRLQTPLGLGRFDWGVNLNPRNGERRSVIHISLGHTF